MPTTPECPFCRAPIGEPHGYGCAIARKQGLVMRAPPVVPRRSLDVGDAVKVRVAEGKVYAGTVVSTHPVPTLRAMDVTGLTFLVTNPLDKDWAFPGQGFPE